MNRNNTEIDPARIQFLYQNLTEGEAIGDAVFFNSGRIPGSVALGNQLVQWNQAFDHSFAGGMRARSPGVVDYQIVQVIVHGQRIEYRWDHTMELARSVYGDRPIIEVECPTGDVMLFSYRALSRSESVWCRVIPTLSDEPMPFGILSRHWDRVWELIGAILLLLFWSTLFVFWSVLIIKAPVD